MNESLIVLHLRSDADDYEQTAKGHITEELMPLAMQWQNDPQGHVIYLCNRLREAADVIAYLDGFIANQDNVFDRLNANLIDSRSEAIRWQKEAESLEYKLNTLEYELKWSK